MRINNINIVLYSLRWCTLFAVAVLLLPIAGVSAIKEIRFVSPLQSLTIPDPELFDHEGSAAAGSSFEEESSVGTANRMLTTPRRTFLPKFLIGLKAENDARQQIALGITKVNDEGLDTPSGGDWVGQAKSADDRRKRRQDSIVEAAHDAAISKYDNVQHEKEQRQRMGGNPNKYQFVGLIKKPKTTGGSGGKEGDPIQWYARPKPRHAKWSVRLVHVNKDAIIKDLFDQGKIDIFAKYTNTGRSGGLEGEAVEDSQSSLPASSSRVPIVTTKYEARERSWKNLWNFSPKHFFTDSSGMYWRERRLRPGMYTDGETVYQSSYRYMDGRNGMHRVGSLLQFLSSSSIDSKDKDRILRKLKEAAPDVVLEM